jgi:DNA-binding CsgD family transcriptional regulator
MTKRGRPRHPDILTPREWEVLALVREGLTNEQIAQRLEVTERTARFHVSEILRKLDVSSRAEAARWSPEERRPWWTFGLAPLTVVWKKGSDGGLATALAGGVLVLGAFGIGVLVWGLLRTSTAPTAPSGPPATAADIIECMHPTTLAENRQSVNEIDPSASARALTLDGNTVNHGSSAAALTLLKQAEPAVFGVLATTARITEPGRTVGHPVVVGFGSFSLELRYVPAGNVAPYGLLFDPIASDAWGIVTLDGASGYTQQVCTVPPQLDDVFADLGVPGYSPTGILETRVVPLNEAQLDIRLERIIIDQGDGAPVVISDLDADMSLFDDRLARSGPVAPFSGDPVSIEAWYGGVDPFPEAVTPGRFTYYFGDGSSGSQGVLVNGTPAMVANGTISLGSAPVYASETLDRIVREAVGSKSPQ